MQDLMQPLTGGGLGGHGRSRRGTVPRGSTVPTTASKDLGLQVLEASPNPKKSKTRFYLVCGGEQLPEKERQDREQMNMICKIILDRGLAKKENIYFISGRGDKINSSVSAHYKIDASTPFTMYGPDVTHPSSDDNAANLFPNNSRCNFIGHGNYHAVPNSFAGLGGGLRLGTTSGLQLGAGVQPKKAAIPCSYGLGDLMFISDSGVPWNYQPLLEHLKAKNTLFISLADYTERTFKRAFEGVKEKARTKKLLAVCLSGYFHVPDENYLGEVFAEFFGANNLWKRRTLDSFCDTLKEKYENHPYVQETRKKLLKQTKETFEEEVRLRQSWASGNFQNLSIASDTISDHSWEMFQAVGEIQEIVEKASDAEITSNLRSKLKEVVTKMVASRIDVIEAKMLRPRAFQVVGDKDFLTMTWKDFLKLD